MSILRKLSASALALLMLVPTLAACSDGGEDTTDTSGVADSADTTVVEETTENPLADKIPADVKFDGYNFRLYADGKDAKLFPTIYRTEETGETVNDAVYLRNKSVEERFGIKITHVQSGGDVYALYKAGRRH